MENFMENKNQINIQLPISYAMIAYLALYSKKYEMGLSNAADKKAIDTLETELRLALKDQAEEEYLKMMEEGIGGLSQESNIQNSYRKDII